MAKIRVLKEADLKVVLDLETGLDIIERTFHDLGTRDIFRLSEPTVLFGGSGLDKAARYKSKGATLITEGVTGIRIISDIPRDSTCPYQSHHMLCVFDDATGAPIGLINETWLHRFRTAMTGVVAAKHLARSGSKILALIGAGSIARELFPAITRTFELDEVRVVARRHANAVAFCDRLASENVRFRAVENPADALEGADIIITLTLATAPVITPGLLSPGSFVCSMGETEEVSHSVLDEIDQFFVDDFEYACILGDLAAWLDNGRASIEELRGRIDGHIGEIVAGTVPGRLNPDQRIIAVIQGMAICDLALARYALNEAEKRGLGSTLDLFG